MAKTKDITVEQVKITEQEYVVCTSIEGNVIIGSKMYPMGEEFILKADEVAPIASSVKIVPDTMVKIDKDGGFHIAKLVNVQSTGE